MNNCIKQRVRYVNYDNHSALVLNKRNKAYPVILSDKAISKGIMEKDLAFIRIINGRWIIVDFERDLPVKQDNFDYAEWVGEY